MIALRIAAAVLALTGVLPLWRILAHRSTGLAGTATAEAAASYSALIWNGVLLALIPAVIAALLIDPAAFEKRLLSMAAPLTRARAHIYALLLAVISTTLAALFALVVMHGQPTLIDSFAQLTHARYFAAGKLAGPTTSFQELWQIQQTITTSRGWASQYPPGYIALLAVGFMLHAVALVGPLMLGVAVYFTARIADLVFQNKPLARVAALLAALSPFMLGMSGAFMSHVPACAFSCATLFFVLRARDASVWYSVAAGLSIGALFAVRPLTAVAAGLVALVYAAVNKLPLDGKAARVGAAVVAALPFLVLVGWYNTRLFGGPLSFGYSAALGSHASLGFGIDPWGNQFGVVESLAYTSAELTALNVFLLQVPLPLTLFIGLYFVLAPAPILSAAPVLLFAWVTALIVANFFYWHHGLFMGPRMLADVGTLWVLLAVMATAGLIARIRMDLNIAGKYSVRAFALGGACAPLAVGILILAPQVLLGYSPSPQVEQLLRAPATEQSSIVFVHGGWTARVAMRLAAHGMRLDSVETALRQNGTCSAHHYSLAYARGLTPDVHLDFSTRPARLPRVMQLSPGNRMRIADGERIDADCAREMAADTAGVVDVTPFIWQGDLPGLTNQNAMFVRDIGPAMNAELIRTRPTRHAVMLEERNGRIRLVPYDVGMRARWGTQP